MKTKIQIFFFLVFCINSVAQNGNTDCIEIKKFERNVSSGIYIRIHNIDKILYLEYKNRFNKNGIKIDSIDFMKYNIPDTFYYNNIDNYRLLTKKHSYNLLKPIMDNGLLNAKLFIDNGASFWYTDDKNLSTEDDNFLKTNFKDKIVYITDIDTLLKGDSNNFTKNKSSRIVQIFIKLYCLLLFCS